MCDSGSVDLAKTYDNISWNFLLNVITEVSFSDKLIQLIMACVSLVNMSIKWNRQQTTYFKSKKGLREGDLMSPYIFVFYMDKLSHVINEAVERGIGMV